MGGRPGLAVWEGEEVEVWERAWGIPRLEAYGSLASTNDRCRELADLGAPAFTSVISREQTAGRGREGRWWSSPAGLGLWMSVLIRPESHESHGLLPILVGVAVCRAIRTLRPEAEPTLKWPNDVQLGGRKVCGILCEGVSGGGVVLGIGVNVRQRPEDFPMALRDNVISIELALHGDVSLSELAGRVLQELRCLAAPVPHILEGDLAEEVASLDALRGVRVRDVSGAEGTALGVAPDGALIVGGEGMPERRLLAGGVTIVDRS
ncbi:MAG: biotin--[acetyl-CoA-carboxylase] ligase [Gemmatimonadota bacterium]|nr:MAG: biotin--[acetyl-CoA-carboxylase] ligase [Gemmatimonadota bacterium]